MKHEAVRLIFDAAAERYDGRRKTVIPCFDDFYKTIIELIPFSADDSFTFLDLGAGTGLLTSFILQQHPHATGTVLDISEKMIQAAKARFSGDNRVDYSIMDYSEKKLPRAYDLIVSAMSIHHLDNPDKRILFSNIFQALAPGAWFIHGELVKGKTLHTEKIYQDRWMNHLNRSVLPEEELREIEKRMSFDKPALLADQLKWLEDAGFIDVDCFYKFYNFAVYAGKKPGETISAEPKP